MDTVSVAVSRAGRIIDSVERPLRFAEGGPAVVYRRKFWRYAEGRIDLDSRPLEPEACDTALHGSVRPCEAARALL